MTALIPPFEDLFFDNQKRGFFLKPKGKTSKRVRQALCACIVLAGLIWIDMPATSMINHDVHSVEKEVKDTGLSPKEIAFAEYIRGSNPEVPKEDSHEISKAIAKWAKEFHVEPTLMLALSQVESSFNKHSMSPVGAMGLTQVMVKYHTDKVLAAKKKFKTPEVFDINNNVYLGSWVLSDCMSRYKVVNKALLCYNGSVGSPNGYDKAVLKAKRDIDSFMRYKRV